MTIRTLHFLNKRKLLSANISLRRYFVQALFLIASSFSLQACNATENQAGEESSLTIPPDVSLAILGYNYTNQKIMQFTVNGNGGDRVELSTPNTGGTGTTCCVRFNPALRKFSVTVRWTDTQCIYKVHTKYEGEFDEIFHIYKTAEVPVSVIGNSYKYIEIHFYPDGNVQAAVTGSMSKPRLQLSADRGVKVTAPRCKNDAKPI